MKKLKSKLGTAVALGLSLPALALAQFKSPTGTNLPAGSILGIVTSVMNWLLSLVGILGVIGFAIAGILYLTAAGDEDRINLAKRAMTWSIVGVIVALLGLVILKAASTLLGGSSSDF